MNIQLRFFASVREALGTASETLSVPAHVATIGQLRMLLAQRGGVWAQALGSQQSLRMAYDQQMSEPDTLLVEGGEVAFFPPVTGG